MERRRPVGPNSPTRRVIGPRGSNTWRQSRVHNITLLDGDCHYASGTVEAPIQPGDGEILIDTTTSPPTYVMHGHTEGPAVEVAQNCGDYAFTTSADGTWSPVIINFGEFFISGDGQIAGSASDSTQSWSWSFHRQ